MNTVSACVVMMFVILLWLGMAKGVIVSVDKLEKECGLENPFNSFEMIMVAPMIAAALWTHDNVTKNKLSPKPCVKP